MIAPFLKKWPEKCKRKPTAVASAVSAETVVEATKHQTLSSTSGLTCDTSRCNAEQDHDFGGGGRRAGRGSNRIRRAIVHPRKRAKSKSLSAKLLREQNLLRNIAKEHSSGLAAACES